VHGLGAWLRIQGFGYDTEFTVYELGSRVKGQGSRVKGQGQGHIIYIGFRV